MPFPTSHSSISAIPTSVDNLALAEEGHLRSDHVETEAKGSATGVPEPEKADSKSSSTHTDPVDVGAGGSTEQDTRPAKLWTSEDSFQCPLPNPDSGVATSWEVLRDMQKKYDNDQCVAMKEEIGDVLIFAALFSAIVAAFTLESSKRLEIDHHETAVMLLFRMHQQLDSIARQNVTTLPSLVSDPAPTFHPPPSVVHVNICWYLSLAFSLGAAVIGILCLQWLREHRSDPNLSASDVFRVRALRIRALDRWKVSALIGALPVLLLAALLLFFGGLLIHLWAINSAVAITASSSIGAIVAVLVITSVLPVVNPGCLSWYVWGYWGECVEWLSRMLEIGWLRDASLVFVCSMEELTLRLRRYHYPVRSWLAEDQQATNKQSIADLWEWLMKSHSEDQGALLAFLRCIELEVNVTPDNMTAMVKLLRRSNFYMIHPASFRGGPPLLLRDAALAILIRHIGEICPSLRLKLLDRFLELTLRIVNSVQNLELPLIGYTTSYLANTCRYIGPPTLSQEIHAQIEETVWEAMTNKNFPPDLVDSLVWMMCSVSPTGVLSLSNRLHRSLLALLPDDPKLENIVTKCATFIDSCDYCPIVSRSFLDDETFMDLRRSVNEAQRELEKRGIIVCFTPSFLEPSSSRTTTRE